MIGYLVISDHVTRSLGIAMALGWPERCAILDLYDADRQVPRPSLIVCDIRVLTSDAFARLRSHLDAIHGEGTARILIVHGSVARTEAQARLLGATTLPAATAAQWLSAKIAPTGFADQPAASSASVTKRADEARDFLTQTFFSGEAITPTLADTGTDLVARAVHENGIRDWVRAVQRFDDVTHQHILLVAGLSVAFALSLGLNAHDRHQLARAALLHDVGKTKIPTAILNKPGRLDPDEWRIMRTHPGIGCDLLAGTGFDAPTLDVVRWHHEMLDGSGYPDGLRAEQIPDPIRLVTISDIYAALIERRPYKAALSEAAALSILDGMVGRLDGDLVRAFRPIAAAFDVPAGKSA